MNNYKLKKMLADAGKDLKAAQEKYAEIERRLKSGSSSTNYILIFKPGAYKKSFDQKMTEFKSSFDALAWLDDSGASYVKSSVDKISKLIYDHEIVEGCVIAFPYEDDKLGVDTLLPFNVCKIVNEDEAICHCRFALDCVQFSAAESNNYKNSDIRKWMANLLSRFDDAMKEHFLTAEVTYLDAKDEQLKVVQDKFWLLDQMELFNFYKTMDERKRTYINNNNAAYWWLRYPNTGITFYEYLVTTSGSSNYGSSHDSYGCAPACLIG